MLPSTCRFVNVITGGTEGAVDGFNAMTADVSVVGMPLTKVESE